MMTSDLERLARETIAMIMLKLDPDRIKSRFDNPVDKTSMEFDYEPTYPITHKEFHRVIAGFVKHVYEKGVAVSWMPADPLAEAIWLLEAGYRSAVYGTGYIAALLDANDPAEGGIQTVLTGMAESIKGIKRQEYTMAVFARYLHGCSWHLRCEIARVLLEDYRAFMPERLGKCAPTQLADEIPALVLMLISSDSVLHQVAFSGVA
jgi:hypothetical protein